MRTDLEVKMAKKNDPQPEAPAGMILERGIKLVGERFAPGSSLLLDGELALGAAHLVGGLAARAVFGPLGWILVAANSYSRSVTGKNLPEHFVAAAD